MKSMVLLCIAFLALTSVRVQAFPASLYKCDSPLRQLCPRLFKHCCEYSDWSEWEQVPGSTEDVPTTQCDSGQGYTERRIQVPTGITIGCDLKNESRPVCCEHSDWSDWAHVPGTTVPVSISKCPSGQEYTNKRKQDATTAWCDPKTESQQVCCKHTDWSDWEHVPGTTVPVSISKCPSGQEYTNKRTHYATTAWCDPKTESQQVCCKHADWSEWEQVPGSTVSVSTSKCPSGQEYTRRRTKAATRNWCDPKTESEQKCVPDQVDRLILALGLGSKGMDYRPINKTSLLQYFRPRVQQSNLCNGQSICQQFQQTPNFNYGPGKRAVPSERMPGSPSNPKSSDTATGSEESPLPFDWEKHHHRFRRQNRQCDNSRVQHILFVLDTSSSVGAGVFQSVTAALSKLPRFFCPQIEIAVMSFNHLFHAEFCFDCFGNTGGDRLAASQKIKDIQYTRGTPYQGYFFTHTAGATQCVCNVLLTPTCGLPATASCITVVYLTDGKSNDPPYNPVCTRVQCLHNDNRVETFAIGVGNYAVNELNCIADSTSSSSVFRFQNFNEFVNALNEIEQRLLDEDPNYECLNPETPSTG